VITGVDRGPCNNGAGRHSRTRAHEGIRDMSAPELARRSPLVVLLAGLSVGILVMVLLMNLQAGASPPIGAGASSTPVSPTSPDLPGASSPGSAVPSIPKTKLADTTRATYAGHTRTGDASIAIAVRDGTAIAYACDGHRLESWLVGTVTAGKIAMTGKKDKNAHVQGTIDADRAVGSGVVGGRKITFRVSRAKQPSGLYRIASRVQNAMIVGGWIVLADGSQVGVVTTDGAPAITGALDPSTGAVTVNGTHVVAGPVDGSSGSGFGS
jgi:hypothetical protein